VFRERSRGPLSLGDGGLGGRGDELIEPSQANPPQFVAGRRFHHGRVPAGRVLPTPGEDPAVLLQIAEQAHYWLLGSIIGSALRHQYGVQYGRSPGQLGRSGALAAAVDERGNA
jgi:hypothetical protein